MMQYTIPVHYMIFHVHVCTYRHNNMYVVCCSCCCVFLHFQFLYTVSQANSVYKPQLARVHFVITSTRMYTQLRCTLTLHFQYRYNSHTLFIFKESKFKSEMKFKSERKFKSEHVQGNLIANVQT